MLARAADVLHRAFPHATLPLAASADLVEQVRRLVHGLLPAWSIRLTGEATGPDRTGTVPCAKTGIAMKTS
jgi:hypothetical protein